jgi:hypothetical protein
MAGGILQAAPALAGAPIQLSTDPYTNASSQHETQVEPDSFAYGGTIVADFQTGRFFDGGASNIGWATSTDFGATWTHGFLPGITVFAGGTYDRVSDPSVGYDAKHRVWIIASLGLHNSGLNDVLASRSTDGGLTWNNPVGVDAPSGTFLDKDWITCDNVQSSPFFGNCYVQFDDNGQGNLMEMSTSTDGGLTWGAPKHTANNARGLGGQPVVLASGKVVVPYLGSGINVFSSSDGGGTWSASSLISSANFHSPAGGLRSDPLPTAEVRTPGPVVVAWADCRFESGCSANDIVFSTSTNGTNWTAVTRVPTDPIGSGVDHFIPGVAVQPQGTTPSTTPHIALSYYYYPVANCSAATCRLNVGFTFSSNGGSTWSPPQQLAGPMQLSWIANTNQGRMVGDYISTSYSGANAFPIYESATPPTGSVFHEATFTNQQAALTVGSAGIPASSAGAHPATGWRIHGRSTAN